MPLKNDSPRAIVYKSIALTAKTLAEVVKETGLDESTVGKELRSLRRNGHALKRPVLGIERWSVTGTHPQHDALSELARGAAA